MPRCMCKFWFDVHAYIMACVKPKPAIYCCLTCLEMNRRIKLSETLVNYLIENESEPS